MFQYFNIILPPVWSGVYVNTARLLQYSLKDLGFQAQIICAGEAEEGDISILLGWHLNPENIKFARPYIIYQLEPLIIPFWQTKLTKKSDLFENAVFIWDYAPSNARFYTELGITSSTVPLGYHSKLQEAIHTPTPDFDVLFVGFLTERRKQVLDEMQHHCCVSIQPRWGKDFTEALGRSKILLNIHQYDLPTPIEQPRIAYALNNTTLVISENDINNPYQELICCNYADLISTVLYYLHNPLISQKQRSLQYQAFRSFKMTEVLRNILNETGVVSFTGRDFRVC